MSPWICDECGQAAKGDNCMNCGAYAPLETPRVTRIGACTWFTGSPARAVGTAGPWLLLIFIVPFAVATIMMLQYAVSWPFLVAGIIALLLLPRRWQAGQLLWGRWRRRA